jgi:hypothetical protein
MTNKKVCIRFAFVPSGSVRGEGDLLAYSKNAVHINLSRCMSLRRQLRRTGRSCAAIVIGCG